MVGGGGQRPPGGLPGDEVPPGVGLTRVDRLDLSLGQLPADITDQSHQGEIKKETFIMLVAKQIS